MSLFSRIPFGTSGSRGSAFSCWFHFGDWIEYFYRRVGHTRLEYMSGEPSECGTPLKRQQFGIVRYIESIKKPIGDLTNEWLLLDLAERAGKWAWGRGFVGRSCECTGSFTTLLCCSRLQVALYRLSKVTQNTQFTGMPRIICKYISITNLLGLYDMLYFIRLISIKCFSVKSSFLVALRENYLWCNIILFYCILTYHLSTLARCNSGDIVP